MVVRVRYDTLRCIEVKSTFVDEVRHVHQVRPKQHQSKPDHESGSKDPKVVQFRGNDPDREEPRERTNHYHSVDEADPDVSDERLAPSAFEDTRGFFEHPDRIRAFFFAHNDRNHKNRRDTPGSAYQPRDNSTNDFKPLFNGFYN